MSRELRVILSGGGTGGHIFPAIAIADEIKRRFPEARIKFVGARDRMEMTRVPKAGYDIEGLWISGLQRKLSTKNLLFPFKLISSINKSRSIIKRFQPDIAIGTGGFASGPLLHMAAKMGIPTLVQEQNSFPGITNKVLAKKADIICAAYEEVKRYFPVEKVKLTGNPVRQDILDLGKKREEALEFFKLSEGRKTVLVLGGSLGAKRINQLIALYRSRFREEGVQLLWQCGELYYEQYKEYAGRDLQVFKFLERMDLAYAAADVIISRAGAGSVSELCVVGKPVVFIPSPNVAEDHQAKNALAITKQDAAITVTEQEVKQKFESIFFGLLKDDKRQEELGRNIKALARPTATYDIVNEVEKLIKQAK